MPKLSLPVRLALLVAGTTLPLILFAAGIILHNYEEDRRDANQRVLETVRSIRLVLDAEVQRMTGGLQVLALTNSLRNGDFESFRRIALGFLDQYGKDGVILVADRDGRQLFSSVTTDTASLPPRNNRDIVEKVFATKQPQYSDLFVGAVKKRQIITVEVPVIRDGNVIYVISFSPPIEHVPEHRGEAAPERRLDHLDLRRQGHQFRARAESATPPSASAPRRRFMRRCSGETRRRCRRCRWKACR